jgi:hypothetical protein
MRCSPSVSPVTEQFTLISTDAGIVRVDGLGRREGRPTRLAWESPGADRHRPA